jgi:hypothetical protein
MTFVGLSILPPLAIGRLGSSPEPLENYELDLPADGLGFRKIVPAETLYIDPTTGAVAKAKKPEVVKFRDGDRIRPVAPFLEVFAHMDDGVVRPLTLELLGAKRPEDAKVRWSITVGNIKAYRRTGDENDKAIASIEVTDHESHPLLARAANFIAGKTVPLGSVRYIRPTVAFPEIRLRFTPAAGIVYGAKRTRMQVDEYGNRAEHPDPILLRDEQFVYDAAKPKQQWVGWVDKGVATDTNPGAIYAGFVNKDGNQESWGYLDDECDGIVTVTVTLPDGRELSAYGRIGAGPPNFAPDGFPVRTVNDELIQALLGKDVETADATLVEAEDILRRAAETVRLMNVAVMNGNPVDGVAVPASTMPAQDANDTHRNLAPVTGPGIVDSRSILALHHAALAALRAGAAPWFSDLLRRPEEIGDLSDAARRKMPALMRGADARYLTLTRRQIDTIVKVVEVGPFVGAGAVARPSNLSAVRAQLEYCGRGNPPVSHPMSAISNCFPGLEFDFRNIWRRLFKGVVLTEHNNLVVEVTDPRFNSLKDCRLLAIDGVAVMTKASGPFYPGSRNDPLATDGNPDAVAFMEWSNNFALFQEKQGKTVSCIFTAEPPPSQREVLWTLKDGANVPVVTVELEVQTVFDVVEMAGAPRQRAVLSQVLAEPGELTQGLCSPWQNDYRECACYYWAASRPDYVNVEPTSDGTSRGALWMQKDHAHEYIPDRGFGGAQPDRRLLNYDDLFAAWERHLQFVIGGKAQNSSDKGLDA